MLDRIHIFGASGSGTSTLAAALAARHGHAHVEADDILWEPTAPPFEKVRERAARQEILRQRLEPAGRWVLAGSVCGWGDVIVARFDLAMLLSTPTEVRLARLRTRERERYGTAIDPGGAMHERSLAFFEWTARYDEGGPEIRSRTLHDTWLGALPCRTARLDGRAPIEQLVASVESLAHP